MKKMLIVYLSLLLFHVNASAQDAIITVNGKVTDSGTGMPFPSANVIEKGTSNGVITNFDGEYSIEVPANAVLVFSYLGYTTREVEVNGQNSLDLILESESSALDEVIVMGYGTQKKSDVTGSVSSVSAEEITQLATQRVDQALQGRAAGVMVMNTDGSPGGNTEVRIRGMNSFYGGNNALIVVDGLQGGDLNNINPNDVESIDVLKDASATAIYGSQGANGVIVITTKKGRTGKPLISYTYEIGSSEIIKKLDLMNAAEYARSINESELSRNSGGITPVPIFSEAEIEEYERNGGVNWQDVIYQKATTQNHQLSIGGASQFASYRISGGYLDQEGILLNSGYKRYSLRANLSAEITNWAKAGLNWAGTEEIQNSALFGDAWDWPNNPIRAVNEFEPTTTIYDENGDYTRTSPLYGARTAWNPLASAVEPLIENENFQNNFNAFLSLDLLEGLNLRIEAGGILTRVNNNTFLNSQTFTGNKNEGISVGYDSKNVYLQNSNILTYDNTFGKHVLNATAVVEQKYWEGFFSNIMAQDFLTEQTGYYDLAGANIVNVSSGGTERVMNSYLGRLNYSFDDRYLFTVSYRVDGSSVFGANNKYGYFPSASVAWRMSQEDFIQDLEFISQLKLRASWGVTGNQAINPYQTLARISSGGNYPYDGTDATNIGFFISTASNPNLKWESTTQKNIGIDVGILKNRFNLTVDYYTKITKDLLMPRELPTYTGLNSIIDNVGSMENKGWEIAIDGYPVVGDFAWNTGFNISSNRTTVLDLGDVESIAYRAGGASDGTDIPFMMLVEGEQFGRMIGWGYNGTWNLDEAAEAARYGQLPGDPRYTDVNDDGIIDLNDQMVIGNSMPDFIFGWNNRLTYGNFELMFQLQGKYGNDIFNIARIPRESPSSGLSRVLLNRWTPQNQDTDVPAVIDEQTREDANLTSTINLRGDIRNTTERWIEDGSYARLKTVTLAFNFPRSFTERLELNNLRINVGGTNLITVTDYSGYDPEVSSYPGNDATLGTDTGSYPQSRIYSLGLSLTF